MPRYRADVESTGKCNAFAFGVGTYGPLLEGLCYDSVL